MFYTVVHKISQFELCQIATDFGRNSSRADYMTCSCTVNDRKPYGAYLSVKINKICGGDGRHDIRPSLWMGFVMPA